MTDLLSAVAAPVSFRKLLVVIEGEPVAKGRPKFARRGAFTTTYTPEKTREYEAMVAAEARATMAGAQPMSGPISIHLQLFLSIPASYSKKKAQACRDGLVVPTKKPDWENVAKSVCDAFNGIVWNDDSQVVDAFVSKRFADSPCVVATITQLDLACS